MFRTALLLVVLPLFLPPRSQERRSNPADEHALVRGMTISCQTFGREWGTDAFARELDRLAALGVNWIAIHPYASVRADGSLRWRRVIEGSSSKGITAIGIGKSRLTLRATKRYRLPEPIRAAHQAASEAGSDLR